MAGFSLFQTYFTKPWENEIGNVKNKIEVLDKKLGYEKRITELEKKIDQITIKKASSN